MTQDYDFGKTAILALTYTDVTTATNGATVSLAGRDGCLFVLQSHALNSGTYTFKLQDSPDGSTWTDVGASYVTESTNSVAFADTEDNTVKQIAYLGLQDNVRCVCTPTSPVGANYLSAVVIVGENYAS